MTALQGVLSASFVLFSVVGPAAAQAPPTTPPPRPTRIQASVGVPVGFASGEFGNNVDSAAGISVSLDVGPGGSIVSVGGELSHEDFAGRGQRLFRLLVPQRRRGDEPG